MIKKKYELIIFDCDGTLVNSEPLTNRLISKMINELNIPMTTARSLELFAGKTIRHITDFIQETHPNLDPESFEKEYRKRCYDLFYDELKPIEGVKELIEELKIPFCVASNGPQEKMAITLPASGLSSFFSHENTFSAYDINSWKPDPLLFQHAAEHMGVSAQKALVIEDTWSGVMGAVNGGIDVWAFNAHRDSKVFVHQVPNFFNMSSLRQSLKHYL